jgi:hypothetical protein
MLTHLIFQLKNPVELYGDLPHPVRIGDSVFFDFTHTVLKGGRSNQIKVCGRFVVADARYKHTSVRGVVQVVSFKWGGDGHEPTWVSVKKRPTRTLPPAVTRFRL